MMVFLQQSRPVVCKQETGFGSLLKYMYDRRSTFCVQCHVVDTRAAYQYLGFLPS